MPQHMGDLILPWPFGHTEIAMDVVFDENVVDEGGVAGANGVDGHSA